jgi:hypothetical protein
LKSGAGNVHPLGSLLLFSPLQVLSRIASAFSTERHISSSSLKGIIAGLKYVASGKNEARWHLSGLGIFKTWNDIEHMLNIILSHDHVVVKPFWKLAWLVGNRPMTRE